MQNGTPCSVSQVDALAAPRIVVAMRCFMGICELSTVQGAVFGGEFGFAVATAEF